ncbi:MAG: type sorting protein, partial [Bacteroidota bacterium]|nr:type sorting protein [Bacteroidota bacterium]
MSNSFELGKIIGKVMLFPIIFFILISTGIELLAQNYEFTLNQRRRFNQIHVEIWAKSLNTTATKIGNASLVLQYNTRYLSPASTQSPSLTDSISYDINQVNPVVSIISPYNQAVNGFNTLGYQSYSTGYYSLEINLATLGVGGYRPGTTGRGTFVGKLAFDIQGNPDDNALTGITWSKSILPGDIRVFDIESNDIESQVNFIDPSGFKVTGITILSPNVEGLVIDRDKSYLSLSGFYADGGYPIYFERSINPDNYKKPSGPPNVVPVDENLGYALSYSLDNGVNWNEFGRVVETERDATQTGNLNTHRSGQIFNPSVANSFIITNQNGAQLNYSNYGDPLRIIWEKDLFVSERSEQARIRITKLAGTITTPIATRAKNTLFDVNDAKFIYGRLFFMQLSGNGQYFVTENNFSNSTQLTVEAWINLNEYQSEGSEPAIVVSSGGPNAEAILGSKEGAWMLYLKDGRYPAFRVREIQGRGDGGYLGSIVSYTNDMITVASDAEPLDNTHAENWMHISATVNNNVVSLYVNGELVDRVSNNIATDIRMLTTSHPVWIGVNPNYSIESQDYIRAGLKEVKIWRTALTQDEIRARVAGVPDPSNTNIYGDLRRGLQLYYSFEGNINDLASNATYQNGNDAVSFVNNGVKDNSAIKYRPDRPHLRLTAPVAGAGVSNIIGNIFNVRWISYGIGDISKSNTNDVALEYSLDNGTSWKYIKNDADKDLGGATAPDVETGTTKWDPGRNNSANANLSSISPYSKNVILRIRGHDNNRQSELMNTSGLFSVAPYFAAKITKGSIIVINGNEGMNISGNSIFLESWIRPYRFPTDEEGFFPIICKRDSTTPRSHYELRLLPTGRIQFRLTDINGNVRIANSDAELPLVMPNSVTTDSAWTHVGVYFYKNNGVGSSEVRFYIDGNVQRADTITTQLGDAINLEILNKYPTYIGYYPSVTMPDTVPGIQTSNITITGNLNSGSLTGTRIPVTRTIYDKAGDTHDYTITFIKDAVNNEFSYIHSIGSKDIWSQTENVIFQGNISATATGASENFSLNLIDWTSGNSHPINLSFNKTANANEFNLVISFNGNNLYQYLTTFNSNGTLASPQTITVAAADLNTALGSVVFDQTTPRNIVIKLTDPAKPTAGLMYTPGQTTT